MRPTATPVDSYESGTLEEAWAEYRDNNPAANHPAARAIFRSGFRRGVAQGAHLADQSFVCEFAPDPEPDASGVTE